MRFELLRQDVCEANLELMRLGLVMFSWGNCSGIDRQAGTVIIKPSGVPYAELTPANMVVVDLEGTVVDSDLQPSSDTPTHLELYKAFPQIGGICHTHSTCAVMWAQACRDLPCFGTTHADSFYGAIPVTEVMTSEEIETDYEANTGKVIVRRFAHLDPQAIPAVLVANHGPFTWGPTPSRAVENAAVLEEISSMAIGTLQINPKQQAIAQPLLEKHYRRKHGTNAYYGQNTIPGPDS